MGAGASGDLRQWKVDSGDEVSPWPMKAKGTVYAAVASMDGRWIVSGDSGKRVIVWNAVTYKASLKVAEHTGCIYAVDVSSDSTRFASGSEDQTVRIFNIISGVRVLPPLHHNGPVVGVKFSPDGTRIATAIHLYASVRVYDTQSANNLFDIPITVASVPITPLAWSSDGQQLFVSSPGCITSFDTSVSLLSEWVIQNGTHNVSIVTHGQLIACSAGSAVSFWDCTSRKQIRSIIDHTMAVNCISISFDGRYLACGHDNGITVHGLGDFLQAPPDNLHVSRGSQIPLMQMSETALESWMSGNIIDTGSILSEEIAQGPDHSHYALAARSFIRAHSREWKMAIEDAEMVIF